jgi:Wiskott-Aldrich syndrome protein
MGLLDIESIRSIIGLGASAEIKATAVVKLYISEASKWEFTDIVGQAALAHADGSSYIYVINKTNNTIALSQELYEDFPYESSKVFFHSFEMDDCVAGLSFADTAEAATFFSAVKACVPSSHNAAPGAHPPPVAARKPAPPPGKPPSAGKPPPPARPPVAAVVTHKEAPVAAAPPPAQAPRHVNDVPLQEATSTCTQASTNKLACSPSTSNAVPPSR